MTRYISLPFRPKYGGTGTDTSGTTGQPELRAGTWYFPKNHVNVRAFGAVGDGVTDDTESIQAAIASVSDIGKSYRILFPPTSGDTPYCISDTLVFEGNGYTVVGWGHRDNYATCLKWIGDDTKGMVRVEHSYGARFETFSLDGGTGDTPTFGLQVRSDNAPATINNLFDTLTVLRCAKGVQLAGETTGLEQVSENLFRNVYLEDNGVNWEQTTVNSQNNTILGGRMGCTTATYAGAETTYNLAISGGSLYGYMLNFEGCKLADVYLSGTGIWGGIHLYGVYTESKNAFLTMGSAYTPLAGGIEIHGLHHVPDAPYAEQTDSIFLDLGADSQCLITNAEIEHGDITIANGACDVTLLNVRLDDGQVIPFGSNPRIWSFGGNRPTLLGGAVTAGADDADTVLRNNTHLRAALAGGDGTAELLRLDDANAFIVGDGLYNMWLAFNDPSEGATLRQVEVGAANSAGTGYRLLRVTNA